MVNCHNRSLKSEYDNLLGRLRNSGCRITKQRTVMARKIVKFDRPFSAEELHKKVKRNGIDLVTVYRSLATFRDLKILSTIDFNEGPQLYEYQAHEKDSHHHHIICRDCNKIEPIHFCAVEGQEKFIEKMGYSDVSHKLEFFGLCNECSVQ